MKAQLNASQAAAHAAREELKHKQQLAELNSVRRFEVAFAEARLAQARAEAQVHQVQAKRCSLTAPFDGRVVQRRAQPMAKLSNNCVIATKPRA